MALNFMPYNNLACAMLEYFIISGTKVQIEVIPTYESCAKTIAL